MQQITSLFNLDTEVFKEWVLAEKRRLPGSSEGFAMFLASLRMLRPAQVVWISDGLEPQTCGYDSSSVARLVTEVLPVGSQLIWAKTGDTKSTEFSYLSGLVGETGGIPAAIICLPDGYEVTVHTGSGILRGLQVSRRVEGWQVSLAEYVPDSSGESSQDSKGGESSQVVEEVSDEQPKRRRSRR